MVTISKRLCAVYKLLVGPVCECKDAPSVALLIKGAYDGEYPLDAHRCENTTQAFNAFRACLGSLPNNLLKKIGKIRK